MSKFIFLIISSCMALMLASCDNKPITPSKEIICGTIRGLTCAEGQYCDFGVGQCKTADAQGMCKNKPRNCTREHKPVCGCDGKTYSNVCGAATTGVSIDHEGECTPSKPQVCGGIAGLPCPDDQTCVDDPSDDCDPSHGGRDCSGICVSKAKPKICGGARSPTECSADEVCVDDPSDDCDPKRGGADCPSICKAK